jgi:3-hydroxybutyryl-CoA dehydrogenase
VETGQAPERGIVLHGRGVGADLLARRLEAAALAFDRAPGTGWDGIAIDAAQLRLTDGRTASALAASTSVNDIAVIDLPLADLGAPAVTRGTALAFSVAAQADEGLTQRAGRLLGTCGFAPHLVADTPGLLVARCIAMLINEAADAVQQGVCTPEGADASMKLGVSYPAGPFEWLAHWDAGAVVGVIEALDACYRGERYRVSPWLRHATWKTRAS